MTLHISADRLLGFIASAYQKVGIAEGDAKQIAGLQTEADLRGADGHGVFRLPQYIRRIRAGGVNVAPNIRIERQTAAMALVDGDNGMGHLVMRFAAQEPKRLACFDAPGLSIWDRCNCATVRNPEMYTRPDSSPELSTADS